MLPAYRWDYYRTNPAFSPELITKFISVDPDQSNLIRIFVSCPNERNAIDAAITKILNCIRGLSGNETFKTAIGKCNDALKKTSYGFIACCFGFAPQTDEWNKICASADEWGDCNEGGRSVVIRQNSKYKDALLAYVKCVKKAIDDNRNNLTNQPPCNSNQLNEYYNDLMAAEKALMKCITGTTVSTQTS